MNSREIIEKKKEILLLLSQKNIYKTFELLSELIFNLHDWRMSEKLSELEINYKRMLQYLFDGTEDDSREMFYTKTLRALYELTDDATDALLKIDSANIFYEKLRVSEVKPPFSIATIHTQLVEILESLSLVSLIGDTQERDIQARIVSVKRERVGSELFNAIFVSQRTNESEYNQFLTFIYSNDVSTIEKSLCISALSLSLFHRFDAKKTQLLMHTSISDNSTIRARAIVGLVLVMQMYDIRWGLYPELHNQLAILSESSSFKKAVLRVIIQLIRARETEQISKKVREEIIPEMMRFNSLAGKKLNMEELMSETDFSDKNPEWKKELEESGFVSKLQEYSNLQMEGADVFHATFAELKSFPFFSEMCNWFLPFHTSYSQLMPIFPQEQKNNLLKAAIVDSDHMCDSDKYSFCFSLLQLSATQRDIMLGQLGAEAEEIKELQESAKNLDPSVEEGLISNQYIQNLYRFFKLNPNRNSFYDIFKLKLNFQDKQAIAPLIADVDSLQKIAFYCFDKNNLKEALQLFNILVDIGDGNEIIWQKIAYCKQILNDPNGALDAYLQSDLIAPNNSWVIKRIAQLYRSLKMPSLAVEYYKKAAQIMPNNVYIELSIGHCYLDLKEYQEALNVYFKVELLDSQSQKALRPIAWTAFLLHKFQLAQNYYTQILEQKEKITIHDYLNAGHVELCIGDRRKALLYYKQGAIMEQDFNQFIKLFELDKDSLIEGGFNWLLAPFLLDQLQYELSKGRG